jgi:hypothetical protein
MKSTVTVELGPTATAYLIRKAHEESGGDMSAWFDKVLRDMAEVERIESELMTPALGMPKIIDDRPNG